MNAGLIINVHSCLCWKDLFVSPTTVCVILGVCLRVTQMSYLPLHSLWLATMQTLGIYTLWHVHSCVHMQVFCGVVRAICWVTARGEGKLLRGIKWRREAEVWRWRQAGRSETDCLCAWAAVYEHTCNQAEKLCVCVCGEGEELVSGVLLCCVSAVV